MVSWPASIDPGQTSPEPVLGLDIMATLASITGTEITSGQAMDSYNLQPILQNQSDARGHSFLMLQSGTGNELIFIEDGWKLIIQTDKTGTLREPIALYDLNTNIRENETQNYINNPAYKNKIDYLLNKYNEVRDSRIPTSSFNSIHLPYDHPHIYSEGRIGVDSVLQAREIYWPGTFLSLKFMGDSLSVTLEDQHGDNYFNVLVDDTLTEVLHLEQGKKTYVLATKLKDGEHTVELHKRNDWTYGWTRFYGFDLNGNASLPQEPKDQFIEFYGNSITTGYGNNYLAYGALTARNTESAYSCISHSGIGIMVSWHNLIMPEEYNRLNPANAESLWDFSSRQPDIVVVNLLQNDSWLVELPEHEQFIRRFGDTAPNSDQIIEAYAAFLQSLRGEYPDAEII
jgi:hypothetical protein